MANVMSSIQYEVVEDYWTTDFGNEYFAKLVVTDPAAMTRAEIANGLHAFIGGSIDPELWAWYGAYDHVAYAQLFGKMIHLPKGMPMHTHDLKTLQMLAGNVVMPRQPEGLHNALADAKFNKVKFDFLWDLLTNK